MSLTKANTAIITFSVMLFILAFTTMLLPEIIDNFITGFASIASINVSVRITHVAIGVGNKTQMDLPYLNGTNITIRMPIIYYGNITMYLSVGMPEGFEQGFGWYVNESGTIKSVSNNGTALFWEADKTITDTYLYFEVSPPSLISDIIYTGDSYYERTFTISSSCLLENVSANISVSSNYQDYVLYLIENNTLINRSTLYHFQVSNSIASFYGFNLSTNKTFRIQAVPNATIIEIIIRGGGGGGGGGGGMPLLNYSQQQFIVEPNYISISSYTRGFFDAYITIHNLRGENKTFNITYTRNFITGMLESTSVPSRDSKRIPILMNSAGLAAGIYSDYISVKNDKDEEKVTVLLELLEEPKKAGTKEPVEEQPATIKPSKNATQKPAPATSAPRKVDAARTISLFILGLAAMGAVVYFHLKSKKEKTIRY